VTTELGNSNAGTQRTRRNIVKMGAILVPMTLGKITPAAAGGLCQIPVVDRLLCDLFPRKVAVAGLIVS
jgi:hypothetical protein